MTREMNPAMPTAKDLERGWAALEIADGYQAGTVLRGKRYVEEITITLSSPDLRVIRDRANDIKAASEEEDGYLKRGVDGITFSGVTVR